MARREAREPLNVYRQSERFEIEECTMLGSRALSDTSKQLRLPADLLAEVQRRGPVRKDDLRVEGWKPSILRRLLALFSRKR
jgi:hypothetical protein